MNTEKRKLLENQLKNIEIIRSKYKIKSIKLKKIDDISDVVIHVCNGITVSSIVLTISTINPTFLIVSAVFSSIGTIGSIAKSAYRLKRKVDTSRDCYLQLTILSRDIKLFLTTDADNHDYDCFITDINNRLALVEDAVSLIRTASISEEK